MLARLKSIALFGIEACPLEIEVDVASGGLPAVVVVGLPDKAVSESRDRVKSAIQNAGYSFPARRITVNLAPADLKKEGTLYDLPIALGILQASEQVQFDRLDRYAVVGELALDGRVRPGHGVLPMAMEARKQGWEGVVVPESNASEAAAVEGLKVVPVADLAETVGFLAGKVQARPVAPPANEAASGGEDGGDFSEVQGQEGAKRALEIAMAGGHHVLMIGSPGGGKTMLAQRLPSIMPGWTQEEALEATRIHSVAGLLNGKSSLLKARPFRSPHHTISSVGLVGGGTVPRPGEISLAHKGILFMDEFPEFPPRTLETLRQPLEEGKITIGRAAGTVTFPAEFLLISAMNSCPCGYYLDPRRGCRCTPAQIDRYVGRVSGPLLDRIDIHLEVPPVQVARLSASAGDGRPSVAIRVGVEEARGRQRDRFGRPQVNARMRSREIKKHCTLSEEAHDFLRQVMEQMHLSARSYHSVLKVARTIADLEGASGIGREAVAEAVQYRVLDRKLWLR
jgi:magnesium chelatase family protein